MSFYDDAVQEFLSRFPHEHLEVRGILEPSGLKFQLMLYSRGELLAVDDLLLIDISMGVRFSRTWGRISSRWRNLLVYRRALTCLTSHQYLDLSISEA